jgi:predicted homoserine dehydrogenase-like protein
MVTAFTDGTKLDLEHVLIANGLGATIVDGGMVGWRGDSVDAVASGLADIALGRGAPITDYVLSPALPHGVFIAATHDAEQAPVLKYLKCGDGPIYVIVRPAIYGHLQALRSVRALARDRRVLLDNTVRPRFSVGATAKRDLDPGERIAAGVGSFELRGRVVHFDDEPDHMPIGLVKDAIVVRALKRGDPVAFDDLELPAGLALDSWCALRERAHDRAASDRPARAVAATADGDQ